MGVFGWSLPPGCGKLPGEDAVDPSPLQDAVLELLENGGIPTATNDQIMALIEAAEIALHDEELYAACAAAHPEENLPPWAKLSRIKQVVIIAYLRKCGTEPPPSASPQCCEGH
jgi:hypothetical protein